MQFTRVNSNPDETNGLLGVIDKVGLKEMPIDEYIKQLLPESKST
jgi:hypothetical protein